MVFQASGKTTNKSSTATDFKDLQLIKRAEAKAVKDIELAKKKAEKLRADVEADVVSYEEKVLAKLAEKLEKEYQLEEKKAKDEAKKIMEKGQLDAEQLKQDVQTRMPAAVEHIVKAIMASRE